MIKNTLFICGNGLDLAHNLKTSYSDFKKYCMKNRKDFFINFSSTLNLKSNNKSINKLWASLEKSIGEISLDKLIKKSTEHERFASYIELKQTTTGVAIVPHKDSELIQKQSSGYMRRLTDLPNELKNYLSAQISLNNVRSIELISKILSSTSKVITFNYTETLETVYNFQKKDILHIHGSIRDQIIIGHGNRDFYSPNTVVNKSDPPIITVRNHHLKYLTEMFKNTEEIYEKHKYFFDKIPRN